MVIGIFNSASGMVALDDLREVNRKLEVDLKEGDGRKEVGAAKSNHLVTW